MAISKIGGTSISSISKLFGIPLSSVSKIGGIDKQIISSWVYHNLGVFCDSVIIEDTSRNCLWHYDNSSQILYKRDFNDNVLASVTVPDNGREHNQRLTNDNSQYLYFDSTNYRVRVNKDTFAINSVYTEFYGGVNQYPLGSYVYSGNLGDYYFLRIDYVNGTISTIGSTQGYGQTAYDGSYLWSGSGYRGATNAIKVDPNTFTIVATINMGYAFIAGVYLNGYFYLVGSSWAYSSIYTGILKINVNTLEKTYIPDPDGWGTWVFASPAILDGTTIYYAAQKGSDWGVRKFDTVTGQFSMHGPALSTGLHPAPGYPPTKYIACSSVNSATVKGYYKNGG